MIVGLGTPDDAAVWRLDEERVLVITTDFFTPVVDDAYDYGAIAAAILKIMDKKLNFLLSYDITETEKRGIIKSKLLSPIIKLIFKSADSVYLSDVSLEKEAKLYDSKLEFAVMSGEGKGLVNQVRHTYTHLLNKQEKKLDRPL